MEKIKNIKLPNGEVYELGGSGLDDKITNCITEVPQRVKLELVDDCVVLKAGSVVIVPNGFEEDGTTQKFDYVTIESDLTQSIAFNGSYDNVTLCYNADTETLGVFRRTTENGSGTENVTLGYYYNTSTNLVSYYADSTADGYRYSLPLGIFSNSAASITSINDVFNGFGYIGQCTFVDKGVKALRANGRNEDGTLNNIETVSNKISVVNLDGQTSILSFFTGEKLYGYGVDNYIIQDSKPTITTTSAMWYSPKDNYTYSTADTGATWRVTDRFYVGQLTKTDATGNITFMTPKKSFRAIDYSEFEEVDVSSFVSVPDYTTGVAVANGYVTQYPCYVYAYTSALAAWGTFKLYADGVEVFCSVNHDSGTRPDYVFGFVGAGVTITNSKSVAMTIYKLKGVNL